ncbi:bacteriophage CI repressor [Rhodobacterales bacterium]|nr:bacteriophage CI repressor [Rhodobacterales bacterium]
MTVDEQKNTEWGLPSRLTFIKGDESTRSFANRIGVKDSSLRSVLKGTRPSIDFVIAVAEGANVSLEWLATGAGRPYGNKPEEKAPKHINRELFDMIAECVERVHSELKVQLSAGGVSATVIDYHDMVFEMASMDAPIEEYASLMPWVEYMVRKEAEYHLLCQQSKD